MKASVRFEVVGLNQLRLLNTLVKDGIHIKDPSRRSAKLIRFSVNEKDKSKTISIMEKLGFSYEIVEEKNLSVAIKKVIPRLGTVVGLIAMIVVSIYLSSFLWKIEIIGNSRLDELTIIRALKNGDISVGKRVNFDVSDVEETLLQLDEISAASAELVGTTLKIEIIESAEISPPKQKGDIVSLYDAEITRIVVNSGTAKVKIGDRVPIGSVLIEGIEYNTAGEPLKEADAQGKIYGKVNFTYCEMASLSNGYRRTGKVKSATVIKFFGFNIGKEPKDIPGFESETTVTRIGDILPLYAITTRYYELEQLPEKTPEQLVQEIKDKAVNALVICAGGSEITATANSFNISDKIFKITVHIEAEVSIGGKRID